MTQKEPYGQPQPRQPDSNAARPERSPRSATRPFEQVLRDARERVRRAAERPSRHALAALAIGAALAASGPAQALPEGFRYDRVLEGLNLPTSVEFARDGRIFVTEQRGVVKVFDSILDPVPDVFADLRTQVHAVGDRGLLGLALHPDFPDQPYVYVTYAYDGGKGANDHPRWGGVDTDFDECVELVPNGGCPIAGRLSRLTASGNAAVAETVLIEDWYQQFRFHSIGMPAFGPDGMLYVSAGEGALSESVDYGQFPSPPYDDTGSPPDEGGSLRVQDLETDGDPVGLNGSIIRVDPMTGAAAPGNPLYGVAGMPENARRMLAYGMRNPFRFAFRPGTGEIWAGDVGETRFEEINIVPDLAADGDVPRNFGWPCYEGPDPHPNWVFAELPICENLYGGLGRFGYTPPAFSYDRDHGGSITGIAFYDGSLYPSTWDGALFFTDFTANYVYAARDADQDGVPDLPADASGLEIFSEGIYGVVELQPGPAGDLFLVRMEFGGDPTTQSRVDRLLFGDNTPPSAALVLAEGSSWTGPARSITFDAGRSLDPDSGSTDPALQALGFAWDLDGDGSFQEVQPERIYADGFEAVPEPAATGATATASFSTEGRHRVGVRVTDAAGASDTVYMEVVVGNSAPTAQITTAPDTAWRSDAPLLLSGTGLDLEDASLPDSAFRWTVILRHCESGPDDCHSHTQGGGTGRQLSFQPPQHEFPSYLRVQLEVTDSGGAVGTQALDLAPATADITLASNPPGLALSFGDVNGPAPFQRTIILGSPATAIAPTTQTLGGITYEFAGWSNGQPRLHEYTATTTGDATLTATYQQQ